VALLSLEPDPREGDRHRRPRALARGGSAPAGGGFDRRAGLERIDPGVQRLDQRRGNSDTRIVRLDARRGAYHADRAAALSGVPKSTVHHWARENILVPSVSAVRVKLWSYADLMGLRTIYWLRQPKRVAGGSEIPRTTMPAVRRALDALQELDLTLWTERGAPRVAVDRAGRVWLRTVDSVETSSGVRALDGDWLDLIEPFSTYEATEGPDLQAPRPSLRIVPGKLSGSPHIVDTRVETIAIAALADRNIDSEQIHALYSFVPPRAIDEAIDLEQQLRRNLKVAA